MHIQARVTPAASPPDVAKFVQVLSEPETPPGAPGPRVPINIEGISGSDLETGGQIVFSFDHDREDDVRAWLEEAGYRDVTFRNADREEIAWVELTGNVPGQLLEAIRAASTDNLPGGKLIKDVVIGQETVPDGAPAGRFYVQIAFQEVKTAL